MTKHKLIKLISSELLDVLRDYEIDLSKYGRPVVDIHSRGEYGGHTGECSFYIWKHDGKHRINIDSVFYEETTGEVVQYAHPTLYYSDNATP